MYSNGTAISIAITIAVIIVIAFFFTNTYQQEDFATRREKAAVIHEWFNQRSDHQYNNYKKSVPDSDIVEYDKILALYGSGEQPTIDDILAEL